MKTRKKIIFISAIIILFGFSFAFSNYSYIKIIDKDLNELKIELVIQHSDTFILVSQDLKLILFDAKTRNYEILKFDHKIYKINNISDVIFLDDQSLLIATNNWIYRYLIETNSLIPFDKTLPKTEYLKITKINHYVSLLMNGKIIIHNGKQWKIIEKYFHQFLSEPKKIIIGSDGYFWVLNKDYLYFLNLQIPHGISKNKILKKPPLDFYLDPLKGLFVITSYKTYSYDSDFEDLGISKSTDKIYVDLSNNIWTYGENSLLLHKEGSFFPVKLDGLFKITGLKYFCQIDNNYLLFFDNYIVITPNKLSTSQAVFSSIFTTNKKFSGFGPVTILKDKYNYIYKYVDQLPEEDLMDYIETIFHWNTQNRKEKLDFEYSRISDKYLDILSKETLKKLIYSFAKSDPEKAVSYQKKLLQKVTNPKDLINEAANLSLLHILNQEHTQAFSYASKYAEKFSYKTEAGDWLKWYNYQLFKKNDLVEQIYKTCKDPIIKSKSLETSKNILLSRFNQNHISKQINITQYSNEEGWLLIGKQSENILASKQSGRIYRISSSTPVPLLLSKLTMEKLISFNNSLIFRSKNNLYQINNTKIRRLESGISNFWVYNDMLFYKLNSEIIHKKEINSSKLIKKIPPSLSKMNILYAFYDKSYNWFYITDSKIYRENAKTENIESINTPTEIIYIKEVSQVHDGGVYLLTNNGIYYFSGDSWEHLNETNGFLGRNIKNITTMPGLNLALAYNDSILFINKNGIWFSYSPTINNKNVLILHASITPEGKIVFSSTEGIFEFDINSDLELPYLKYALQVFHYLKNKGQISELIQFLKRYTNHHFLAPWAYKMLGFINLDSKEYVKAFSNFELGDKLDNKKLFFSDTLFLSIAHDFYIEGKIDICIQSIEYLTKTFPQTKLKKYLSNHFFNLLLYDSFQKNHLEKIKLLCGLTKIDTEIRNDPMFISYLNDLLLNYYNTFQSLDAFIIALKFFPDNSYLIFWKYYMSEYMIKNRRYKDASKIIESINFGEQTPLIRFAFSRLKAQIYLSHYFNK